MKMVFGTPRTSNISSPKIEIKLAAKKNMAHLMKHYFFLGRAHFFGTPGTWNMLSSSPT